MQLKRILLLIIIITIAGYLRLYQLGQNPPSLDWDEASIGWNAYSILKTGTDEYGKAWPVSIRSFNDYKPPLYVYAAIAPIAIFGLNEFSVRLPSAIAGILTVLMTLFLVKQLSKNDLLSYCAAILLAISPWSIGLSRVAFEANIALFFFVAGAYFLVRYLNKPSFVSCILYPVSFILSIYSYHSSRLVIPVFIFWIFVFYHKIFLSHLRFFLVSCFLFLVLLYPLARNTLHVGSLSARYEEVNAFRGSSPVDYPRVFLANYLSHFNFDFLFLSADGNPRHHAPDIGLLYLIELPLLLTGLYFLAKDKPKFLPFLLAWVFAAPLASSLTRNSPHVVRSLPFLPTFQIIISYGLIKLLKLPKALRLLMVVAFLVNIFFFLHQYFVHFPVESAKSWQFGYKQMVKEVLAIEKNYDRIYVTNAYDQPYIYFLFYGRVAPIIKNSGYFYSGFDKYQFSLDFTDKDGLFIWTPEDKIPDGVKPNTLKIIKFPDNTTAFFIGTIKNK